MKLHYTNEAKYVFPFDARREASRVLHKALKIHNCPFETEISLVIVSKDVIQETNKEYRGIDKVTDVLSFPGVYFKTPDDFDALYEDGADISYFDQESGNLMLGDIMICADKICEQAQEYQHSLLREYAFLICHSVLHLLGYDHITAEERKVMEEKQSEIMNALGIQRD